MKHFHYNRLLKLADFLDKLPRRLFDYTDYGMDNDSGKLANCKTAACAWGWAPSVPSIRRAGLKWRKGFPSTLLEGEVEPLEESAAKVFGLNDEEATYLFLSGLDALRRAPKGVAKKIRNFVKLHQKTGYGIPLGK